MAEKRTVHIPGENIPHFLTKGHYTVRVQAFSNDEEVVCLSARFDLAWSAFQLLMFERRKNLQKQLPYIPC